MNTAELIYQESKELPEFEAKEVLDFVAFLKAKRQRLKVSMNSKNLQPTKLTDAEIEQACGILTAPHGVSLEQMDEVIKRRGGHL
jgi:hypothetical protein